jgi:hypothetical protein
VALGEKDAAAAYQAMATLADAPRQTVELLDRLRAPKAVEPRELDRLMTQLDADAFAVRERASSQLAALGTAAEVTLRSALSRNPSPEVQRRVESLLRRLEQGGTSEQLRLLRSIEVLEYLGTPEAQAVIKKLIGVAPSSPEIEEAKAALKRLRHGGIAPS